MYKTNQTNGKNSSSQANSFVNFQQDLFSSKDESYNPDLLAIKQVFWHYHEKLKSKKVLIQHLIDRKINAELIDQFKIGFSDRSLGFELLSPTCLLGSRNRGQLQKLGLLKETGHEFFRGALVIPYLNKSGEITGAYGRRLKQQPRNPSYHLYWNSNESCFFNTQTIRQFNDLILCKSPIDAMTLVSSGFNNVVATLGIQGFNQTQLQQLVDSNIKNVSIAFGNTPKADRYARLISQSLASVNINCWKVNLPIGHDVNSFALGQVNFQHSFRNCLTSAERIRQTYNDLNKRHTKDWLFQLEGIDECVDFYLKELQSANKSSKTLNSYRIHLDRFVEFCHNIEVDKVTDLTDAILESYQYYLQREKNIFTGTLISLTTQIERMDAVRRWLIRLQYYGVIETPIDFVWSHNGVAH